MCVRNEHFTEDWFENSYKFELIGGTSRSRSLKKEKWKSTIAVLTQLTKSALSPQFFFAKKNLDIMWSKSLKKFSDLLELLFFRRWSKYRKFNKNGAILVHVGF